MKMYTDEEIEEEIDRFKDKFREVGWDDFIEYQYDVFETRDKLLRTLLDQSKTLDSESGLDRNLDIAGWGPGVSFYGQRVYDYPAVTSVFRADKNKHHEIMSVMAGNLLFDSIEAANETAEKYMSKNKDIQEVLAGFQRVIIPVKLVKNNG